EDRLDDQLRRHLHHAVPHRRDTQGPLLSIGLRDVTPPDRLRPVLPCLQLGLQLIQESLDAVLLELGQGLFIDPRRALVPPHSLPRLLQDVTPVDAIVQSVEAPIRAPLGRGPQSPSKLSHFVDGLVAPAGVVGPSLSPGHALTLTSVTDLTTAGVPPSGRVVLHDHHRCIDPLGLPLSSATISHSAYSCASP